MVKKTNKCSEYVELIHLAFDGDLGENARKTLDEHVKTCADCAGEMHLVDGIRKLFDDLPTLEVPRGFNDAVLASVRRARTAERTRPTAVWLRWAAGLTAATAGIYAAAGVEALRSIFWSFAKSIPQFIVDATAAVAPLLRLATSLVDTTWTLFTTALNLTGPVGERLALEHSVLLGTLTAVVCLYYVFRQIIRRPVRLPII